MIEASFLGNFFLIIHWFTSFLLLYFSSFTLHLVKLLKNSTHSLYYSGCGVWQAVAVLNTHIHTHAHHCLMHSVSGLLEVFGFTCWIEVFC